MSTRKNSGSSRRLYSNVTAGRLSTRKSKHHHNNNKASAKPEEPPQEVIPPVVTDKPVCAPPTEPVTVREAQEAKPDLCAINTLVNAQMESVPTDELEKRPNPGKLSIVYAHGATLINEYFVVPRGYYFYFDSVKSESTALHRSGSQDYTDEAGNVHRLDPFESTILKPETRHTAIDKSIFMHQYAPGDVMTNHSLNFYPGESTKHLSKSELKKDGNNKLICGVIRPDMVIRPDEFLYTTSGLNDTFVTFAELAGGKIPFSADTTLYDIIHKGITLDNGQVYKLPPGHIVLKSCRNLVYGKRNRHTDEVNLLRIDKSFISANTKLKVLTRMPSTGTTNNINTARAPNRSKKQRTPYPIASIFRGTHHPVTLTIDQATPMSTTLSSQASGKSRVYVTNYVRQEFPSKIDRYNTKILKLFNDRKYMVKPEYMTMFPYNPKTKSYTPIDTYGLLTPYDVYNVIMANTCHVCMRNLANLTGNSACNLCKVVGFCAEHKGGASYEIMHECVISFYTEDEVKEIDKSRTVIGELEQKIHLLVNDIKAIERQIKETSNSEGLLAQRVRLKAQLEIYKQSLLENDNIVQTINKKHENLVSKQAVTAQAELKAYEAKRIADRKKKNNESRAVLKGRLAKMFNV
jgi:hypothetical protein